MDVAQYELRFTVGADPGEEDPVAELFCDDVWLGA